MNEQIKKLAVQAFSFASAADDSDESDDPDANWWEKYNEKFAELIVRECTTKMALEIMNNSWIDDAVKNTYQHFGVEE